MIAFALDYWPLFLTFAGLIVWNVTVWVVPRG